LVSRIFCEIRGDWAHLNPLFSAALLGLVARKKQTHGYTPWACIPSPLRG